jgi:peptidylprolyl isomerase/peptidyl-prolyl cis-trans isomerase B (cyclophilin B)
VPQRYDGPPPATIDLALEYSARLRPEHGDIEIRLRPDLAPVSVNSFVFLAREGFYDGSTFHRVIPGFIAQGGDPTGSGRGGPGYTVADELSDAPFDAGAVGFANSGPDTNGSQFFVVLAEAHQLNGRYTLFGEVTAGMDVAWSLRPRDPSRGGELPPGSRIEAIEILER